jgi:hypothetical protein
LENFVQRFPLIVQPAELLKERADEHRERQSLVEQLITGTAKSQLHPLKLPPRQYQTVATDMWLTTRGLLLADEVGLGKTIVGIAGLVHSELTPALVVTLSHLPKQWADEIAKFSDLTTHILRKGQPYDILKYTNGKMPDVIICNYHKLAGWAETLAPLIKSVVFDEVHELRHQGTGKYQAAKHLAESAEYHIGLSIGFDSLLLLRGGTFGSGWYGRIESAYDKISGVVCPLVNNGYCIASTRGLGIEARGWDESRGFCWKPVKSFIRHACDKPTSEIRLRGRNLTVTDDHSLFKIEGDNLRTLPSCRLNKFDLLPLDNGRNWDTLREVPLDVFSILRVTNRTQVLVEIGGLTREDLNLNSWQWQNLKKECKHGCRVSLDVFLKNRHKLPEPTGAYFASRGGARLLGNGQIALSKWAYILGFFLGDGWINKDSNGYYSSVSFSIDLPTYDKIRSRLSSILDTPLEFEEKKRTAEMVELKCCNALFAQIVAAAFGGNFKCWEKSIPAEWLTTWPHQARVELLEGLVDSDGYKSRDRGYSYTTTSPRLAQSISLLLKSLGIDSSTAENFPSKGGVIDGRRITGTRNKYDVYWTVGGDYQGAAYNYKPQERWNQAPIAEINPCPPPDYVYDLEMEGHPSFVFGECGVLGHNSATPIFNFGGEIYNVINLLSPDTLGTWDEFQREWCTHKYGKDKPLIKDPAAFGLYAREMGLMLRRTRKDVKRELPEITVIPHTVEADLAVLNSLKGQAIELAKLILRQGEQDFKGQKMQAAGQFDLKMRQATGIAKCPYVAEFIRMLIESSGEPVVVGVWHREVYEILMEALKEFNPVMFSGSESPAQKEVSKQKFIKGESKVLLLSLRSGAGMNGLQDICHIAVIAELDWSPSALKQFLGRIHRDGQDDPVTAYYLLADHGSDPVMSDILGIKRMQLESIINPNQDLVEELQLDENYIRKMAENFLTVHGIELPKSEPEVTEISEKPSIT